MIVENPMRHPGFLLLILALDLGRRIGSRH